MWRVLRDRGGDERGAIMVIVAILTVLVFLPLAALAIDIPSYDQAQRQAQAAADAGALAASQDLPSDAPQAISDAKAYVASNMASVPQADNCASPTTPGICAITPYNGDSSQIQVTVLVETPTFFGTLMGAATKTVSASAVAGAGAPAGPKYAMYTKSTSTPCVSTLTLDQTSLSLNGGLHSNGGILSAAHNSTYGAGSTGPAPCTYTEQGGPNSFGGSPTPTTGSVISGWPEDYTADFPVTPFTYAGDPNCKYVSSDLNLQSLPSTTLLDGTYCATTIEFNEGNLSCTCTFVASSSMTFNNGPDNFTPSFKDLSMYDMAKGKVNINANGTSFFNGGTDFVPNASSVTVDAPSGTISGFIEAQRLTINGGGPTTWNGSGPASGSSGAAPSLLR